MERSIPKKILFLTYGFAVGGAETLFVNLVNSLDRTRVEPIVVSLSSGGALEQKLSSTLRVITFPRRSRFDLRPSLEIAQVLVQERINTAFALGPFSFFMLKLALLKARKQVKTFVSLHSNSVGSFKVNLQRTVYGRLLNREDMLVTVCQAQAKYWSKKYFIPLTKFKTVYNGVNLEYWTPPPAGFDRGRMRRDLGIQEKAFVIVMVAAFRKEKGHENALRAFSILQKRSPSESYLLFVGGGNEERESLVRNMAIDLGLMNHVKFCGLQTDVRPFYWVSDLATLASREETFSVAALESMAAGLPCVLTDVGGAREMIFDGVNGFVVSPDDPESLAQAWLTVMDSKDTFSSARIRSIVSESFSLDSCVRAYEEQFLGCVT